MPDGGVSGIPELDQLNWGGRLGSGGKKRLFSSGIVFCPGTMYNKSLYCTFDWQGATRFFGAKADAGGVILVAGRQPGCLVCLASVYFRSRKTPPTDVLPLVNRWYDTSYNREQVFKSIFGF